ncbi:MAG: oligosaccharide flippase family protein [Gammaproteobacteria bacterium]|nr:oligosaccharide flippase family protein [Gammaproteobacteria bacterium]
MRWSGFSGIFLLGSHERGGLKLIFSTALGQGFFFLCMPILSRFYTPEAFGKFALFGAFFGIASTFLSLRYEVSITSQENEKDAITMVVLSLLLGFFFSSLFSVIFLFFVKYHFFGFSGSYVIAPIIMYFSLLFMVFSQASRFYLLRSDNYNTLSKISLYQNIDRVLGQVFFGFIKANYLSLLLGDFFGRCMGFRTFMKAMYPALRNHIAGIKQADFFVLAKKNKAFPLYSLPSSIVDAFAACLFAPFVLKFFGARDAGLYFLASRVLAAPVQLIASNYADAFHAQIAELALKKKENELRAVFFLTTKRLSLLAILPSAFFIFIAPDLFGCVLGKNWYLTGVLIAILTPWMFFQFVVSPLSRVVFVLGGQRAKIIYDLLALMSVIFGVYFGFNFQLGFVKTVGIVSALNSFSYVVYFLILVSVLSKKT